MGSIGKTAGRVATGWGTWGGSELAGLIGGDKTRQKIQDIYMPAAGAVVGGGLLGGAGSGAGGALGSLFGSGSSSGSGSLFSGLGGGAGGSGSGLGNLALGGSLLGLGMSQDVGIPPIEIAGLGQTRGMVDQEMQRQNGIYNQGMESQRGLNSDYLNQLRGVQGEQTDTLSKLLEQRRNSLMGTLTSGPEAEAFKNQYNRLGLLNSGAFNEGLTNQFGQLERQNQSDILANQVQQQQAMQGAVGQGYGNLSAMQGEQLGTQSGLSSGGLGRDFGLQDVQTQVNMARAIQEAQQKAQLQQTLIKTGGQILGSGMASGGAGNGNPLGSLLGGAGSLLGNVYGKFFGGGAQPSGTMGDQPFPQGFPYNQQAGGGSPLDLYGGGNPFGGGGGVMRYWG